MSLRSAIKSWVAKSFGLSEYARRFVTGQDMGDLSDAGRVSRPFANVMLVHRCVSKLAQEVAGLPFVITDGREDRIESGDLYDLARKPAPDLDSFEFWEQTVGHYLIGGEVFWVVREFRATRPLVLQVVAAVQMTALTARGGEELVGWKYRDALGREQTLALDEVIQIKSFNPYDRWRGLSPLEAGRLTIAQNYRADEFNAAALANNAEPGGVLTGQDVTEEQAKQIRSAFEDRHRGAGKARRIAVLSGGLTWQQVASTYADMEFSKLKEMSQDEICILFGTPPPCVGILRYANYKSEQAAIDYFTGTIVPLAQRLGRVWTNEIARRFGEFDGWFDTDQHSTAQAIRRDKIDVAAKLFGMGLPLNAIVESEDLGYEPVPWGDRGYLPISLQPADLVGEPVPAVPESQSAAREVSHACAEAETAGTAALKTAIWERWTRSWRPIERRMKSSVERYFYRQRRGILERLQASGLGAPEKSQAKGLDEVIIQILGDRREENARLRAALQPGWEQAVRLGIEQAFAELGQELPSDAFGRLQEIVGERYLRAVGLNDVTREAIQQTLRQGVSEGETLAQLAQRVRDDYRLSPQRATTIARTEVGGSVSTGRHEGLKRAGAQRKSWLSARDATVRTSHQIADSKYSASPIPIDEPFIVGGASLQHPGDPSGPAREVINCSCVEVPVVMREGRDVTLEHYATIEFRSADRSTEAEFTRHGGKDTKNEKETKNGNEG